MKRNNQTIRRIISIYIFASLFLIVIFMPGQHVRASTKIGDMDIGNTTSIIPETLNQSLNLTSIPFTNLMNTLSDETLLVDSTITVIGSWNYFGEDWSLSLPLNEQLLLSNPIRFGLVMIWDMDGPDLDFGVGDDDLLGFGYTTNSGDYSFVVTNVDEEGGGIEAYTTVHVSNDCCVVTPDDSTEAYWYYSGIHSEIADGETADLGLFWFINTNYDGMPCFIMDTITEAHDWVFEMSGYDMASIDVRYPIPGTTSHFIHDPRHIGISTFADWSFTVECHEYGHAIMYDIFDNNMPPGSGVDVHSMGIESNLGNAFSEGWAQFLPSAVKNNATLYESSYTRDEYNNVGLMTYHHFSTLESARFESEPDQDALGNDIPDLNPWDGSITEGSVAAILWDIFDDNTAIDTNNIYYPIPGDFNNAVESWYSDDLDIGCSDNGLPPS